MFRDTANGCKNVYCGCTGTRTYTNGICDTCGGVDGRPEPEGLGKLCGWCGSDIRRRGNKVWRADGRACFCSQQCHDECDEQREEANDECTNVARCCGSG